MDSELKIAGWGIKGRSTLRQLRIIQARKGRHFVRELNAPAPALALCGNNIKRYTYLGDLFQDEPKTWDFNHTSFCQRCKSVWRSEARIGRYVDNFLMTQILPTAYLLRLQDRYAVFLVSDKHGGLSGEVGES